MALVLTSGPLSEPVSLEEVKLHLRIDHTDEDVLLASLVTAARIHLETMLGQCFLTQQWNLVLDHWPNMVTMVLPLGPVQAITAVTLYDMDNQTTLVDTLDYSLDAISQPARLIWRGAGARPKPGRNHNGIEISLTVGFGNNAGDVPQPLRQAILLLVAHWYEHREPVGLSADVCEIPHMVALLTNAYRRVRL